MSDSAFNQAQRPRPMVGRLKPEVGMIFAGVLISCLFWWWFKGMASMIPFFRTGEEYELNRRGIMLMLPPPADILVIVWGLYRLIEFCIMEVLPEALKAFDEKWRRVK